MKTTQEIHNGMDVIDSRDVIARIKALESDREDLLLKIEDAKDATDDKEQAIADAMCDLESWDEDGDGIELKQLKALADEASGCADWQYGEALIRDNYFTEYAQQLAEDCGMLKDSDTWPGR